MEKGIYKIGDDQSLEETIKAFKESKESLTNVLDWFENHIVDKAIDYYHDSFLNPNPAFSQIMITATQKEYNNLLEWYQFLEKIISVTRSFKRDLDIGLQEAKNYFGINLINTGVSKSTSGKSLIGTINSNTKPNWMKMNDHDLAVYIIQGGLGATCVGAKRKEMLGSRRYNNVQKEIDKIFKQSQSNTPKPTTAAPKPTATTTIKGKTFPKSPKPTTAVPKPTATTTIKGKTFSNTPKPTATPKFVTKQPIKTVAPQATKTVAPTQKITSNQKITQAPVTPKPTSIPNPQVTRAPQDINSKFEEEIRRMREQVQKEQQERIKLEQQIQQQTQQHNQQQQVQQTQSFNPIPTTRVVQPEQVTVAPTPEITIPTTPSDTSSIIQPSTSTDSNIYDSLPNPNVDNTGSSKPNSSSSSGGFNPLPWGIGLGAAVAGGVGVKAYVNHRKNSKFDDENEDSVTNGNRFWTDEDPNVLHSEQDLFNQDDGKHDVSYQAVENSTNNSDSWNIEESELPDDNTFDLLSDDN